MKIEYRLLRTRNMSIKNQLLFSNGRDKKRDYDNI